MTTDGVTKKPTISRIKDLLFLALGLSLIGLLFWGGYQIIALFIDFFAKLDKSVAVAVIAGSATIITSTLTVVLGRYF